MVRIDFDSQSRFEGKLTLSSVANLTGGAPYLSGSTYCRMPRALSLSKVQHVANVKEAEL